MKFRLIDITSWIAFILSIVIPIAKGKPICNIEVPLPLFLLWVHIGMYVMEGLQDRLKGKDDE